ncbi:hypothetical protein [Parendozoicomonas haliclonae]|uniref:hypothetical protein n=1 Tax=Parendozoicomonas haliclonae TaxID=1960125 RepID=UPI0039EFAF19
MAGEVLSVLDRVGLHAPNKEEFQEELMLSIIALKPEQETIETGSEPTVEPDTRPTLMGFCRIVKAGDLQFIMNFLTSAVNLETSAYAHVKHLTDGWVMDASHGVITKVTLGELTDIYNVIYPKSGTTPRQVQDALTKHGFGKLNTIYKDGGHVYGYPIKWR